jgi:PAS domain S-box-containing protein
MNNMNKTREELIKELHDLQQEHNSMKELYEKEITGLRQAEKTLAHEQYLMDVIMNNLPDHIYFKDRESHFIRINKDHAHSFGLSDPSQAVGKTDFDFFTEEHARQAYEDEQTIIRTGQPLSKEEKLTWPDRPDTWSSTTKLPMCDKEGNIVGTFGISKDITKRKLSEEALRESELKYRNLLEQAPDIIFLVDAEGNLLHVNLAGKKMLGYSEDELSKMKTVDTYPIDEMTDGRRRVIELREMPAGETMHFERLMRRKDGTLFPVEINVGTLEHGNTHAIIRDITERKHTEKEIKLKNELLQTVNAEKDKFFSILAHDLKGTLSAFLGTTQILTEEIQTMTLEEIKEITVGMKESATNIYGLLENLLEWSRLKRGMMDFIPESLNVKQKITACIEVLTESARKKKIKINYSLPEDLTIYADSHMFETVIRNLVSNAIKFTPKSGEINVSATTTPDNIVEIKICDTGIGMNRELINRLFLLNEKPNRKGTEGEPSTGLGLLLCKEFIEKHNGNIWVESEEGKGSTFSFTIPDKI